MVVSTISQKPMEEEILKKKDPPKEEKANEMTEEDVKLQSSLDALVETLCGIDAAQHMEALESMRTIIRASTTSMTSVPKPLKFMRQHYAKMKEIYEKMEESPAKKLCADIVSVLAMTSGDKSDCIKFRIKGSGEPIGDWGHEYVRHLLMEMAEEYRTCAADKDDAASRQRLLELTELVREIVVHNLKHNAEVEACDLLVEIERLDFLIKYVEEVDHSRVCLYLLRCAPLMPDPDNHCLIRTAMEIYSKFNMHLESVRCAIILNDVNAMRDAISVTKDETLRKQIAMLLGRQQIFLDMDGLPNSDKLSDLNSNADLHLYYLSLAKELDIVEPKTPEAIYKSHLEQSRSFSSSTPDSAKMNLAAAFVNGFVNMGFCIDKMMNSVDDANKWFHKNKDYGMMSAAASQGLIWRWNIDSGLAQCDRFLYVSDEYIKAGTLLAVGLISSGIQDPCDPASALLLEHLSSKQQPVQIGSIFGLALAYANSKRETVLKDGEGGVVYEMRRIMNDTVHVLSNEAKGVCALGLGFILVGTADHAVATELLQILMEKNETELQDTNMRFLALGIALIFLGTQEKSEVFVESLRVLPEPFGSMVSTLVDVCAYAGTGNVLKIQKLLHICSEHYETKDPKKKQPKDDKKKNESSSTRKVEQKDDGKVDHSSQQAVAVLGISLIAMGEEIGEQMSLRTFGHLMRYGEAVIRRAVPLALALLSTSNPQLSILESLSKYSHDSDAETAHNAIFAMGIVGAGTNNARLVAMLRQLASYHHKDQVSLMLIRISQGLTHLGKGTITLNPFHSDRQLMCPAAVAGLFTTCFAFLDANNTILNNRQHFLLYSLVLAMQPRLLITLMEDEDDLNKLNQVNVSVRVGQAVDVVAQAGKPKTITGFQTHTTPVLMAYGERAELATDEYISMTPYLEGLVLLKKNPNYESSDVNME